jgi:hypothetical protein
VTVVEIPVHVCHILDTYFAGETATIGSDCNDSPLWHALPCVDIDAGTVACSPQDLTLTAAVPVDLPLAPMLEEPP